MRSDAHANAGASKKNLPAVSCAGGLDSLGYLEWIGACVLLQCDHFPDRDVSRGFQFVIQYAGNH